MSRSAIRGILPSNNHLNATYNSAALDTLAAACEGKTQPQIVNNLNWHGVPVPEQSALASAICTADAMPDPATPAPAPAPATPAPAPAPSRLSGFWQGVIAVLAALALLAVLGLVGYTGWRMFAGKVEKEGHSNRVEINKVKTSVAKLDKKVDSHEQATQRRHASRQKTTKLEGEGVRATTRLNTRIVLTATDADRQKLERRIASLRNLVQRHEQARAADRMSADSAWASLALRDANSRKREAELMRQILARGREHAGLSRGQKAIIGATRAGVNVLREEHGRLSFDVE